MVKSLIVVLKKLKILHKCTKTDLQTEKYVCSDLGSEYPLWRFDQNGLQIREIKSMCSKYTITLDVSNEILNFSSYFKVLCPFFYYKICDCNLLFAKVVQWQMCFYIFENIYWNQRAAIYVSYSSLPLVSLQRLFY